MDKCHYEGKIQHVGKHQGEAQLCVPGYSKALRADGYRRGGDKIFEFYGCYYHGCPKCTPSGRTHQTKYMKFEELYTQTMNREQALRDQGWQVESIWECNWRRELQEDPETREMFCIFVEPNMPDLREIVDPRKAIFGGRMDCNRIIYDCVPVEGEEEPSVELPKEMLNKKHIRYIDVTSLYPWVNKNGVYPTGHPEIICSGQLKLDMETLPIEDRYFGLVYCRVLPPQSLFHPVLPHRIKVGPQESASYKLFFTLCRTCAEEFNTVINGCTHDEYERSFEGIYTTTELDVAIREGYRVPQVFEVWNYHNRHKGLFADYINFFLKGKQEVAGWPANCTTPESRQKYLDDYFEREGIRLDPSKIGETKNHTLYISSNWHSIPSGASGQKTKTKCRT